MAYVLEAVAEPPAPEIEPEPKPVVTKKKHNKNKLPPRIVFVPEWNNIREEVRKRDVVCMECGTPYNLAVHHIDKNIYNNDLSNLVLLCHHHHFQKHH